MADKKYYDKLRAEVLTKLGDRCNNPECRWLNSDGSLGCTDPRALQIDHINGGGVQEHLLLKRNHSRFYRNVIADATGKYQLLCANCNWIKREQRNENPGLQQGPCPILEASIGPVTGRLLETRI